MGGTLCPVFSHFPSFLRALHPPASELSLSHNHAPSFPPSFPPSFFPFSPLFPPTSCWAGPCPGGSLCWGGVSAWRLPVGPAQGRGGWMGGGGRGLGSVGGRVPPPLSPPAPCPSPGCGSVTCVEGSGGCCASACLRGGRGRVGGNGAGGGDTPPQWQDRGWRAAAPHDEHPEVTMGRGGTVAGGLGGAERAGRIRPTVEKSHNKGVWGCTPQPPAPSRSVGTPPAAPLPPALRQDWAVTRVPLPQQAPSLASAITRPGQPRRVPPPPRPGDTGGSLPWWPRPVSERRG